MSPQTRIQAFISTGHINIVTALEIIVSHTHLGLVMEYASGGAMVRYIADNMKPGGGLAIDENEARYYFIQLLSAIEHCHKHKVRVFKSILYHIVSFRPSARLHCLSSSSRHA